MPLIKDMLKIKVFKYLVHTDIKRTRMKLVVILANSKVKRWSKNLKTLSNKEPHMRQNAIFDSI